MRLTLSNQLRYEYLFYFPRDVTYLVFYFLTLCVCQGKLVEQSRHDTVETRVYQPGGLDVPWTGDLNDLVGATEVKSPPFIEISMNPVPRIYYNIKLDQVKTYHDLLRIFYGNIATNDIIDDFLLSLPQMETSRSRMSYRRRPRIGGLDEAMSYTIHIPQIQDMDNDKEIHIPNMDVYGPADVNENARSSNPKRHRKHRRKGERRHGRERKQQDEAARENFTSPLALDIQSALQHVKEMTSLAECRHPVPVVIKINELTRVANRLYSPSCTVVHRCRADSGCCDGQSVCSPKTNATIIKPFLALEYVRKGDQVRPAGPMVENFTFVNHTECECKPLKKIPTCLQCPHPFSLRRENDIQCICDCFDRDRYCIPIKKGRKSLTEEQLRCIKEERCHPPRCQYGDFDEESIRTGYCPLSRRAKLKKLRQQQAVKKDVMHQMQNHQPQTTSNGSGEPSDGVLVEIWP